MVGRWQSEALTLQITVIRATLFEYTRTVFCQRYKGKNIIVVFRSRGSLSDYKGHAIPRYSRSWCIRVSVTAVPRITRDPYKFSRHTRADPSGRRFFREKKNSDQQGKALNFANKFAASLPHDGIRICTGKGAINLAGLLDVRRLSSSRWIGEFEKSRSDLKLFDFLLLLILGIKNSSSPRRYRENRY